MTADYTSSFSSLSRLYGGGDYALLQQLRICVVGIGGVGSWAVEALARTGIGHITMIDHDDVTPGNLNRQLHALSSTVEQSKVEVMKQRIEDINPDAQVHVIEDFVTPENVYEYLDGGYDVVIDAADSVKAKAAIIASCKRIKCKIVCIGGAGGQTDPLQISKADLAKTIQDPLLAKVRSELRRQYGFSKNVKRNFGVECIFSTEQLKYPTSDGGITQEKVNSQGASKMDCATGFGSFVGVTASFGMLAASRAIHYIVNKS